ncbi:hypothetical protein ACQEVF_44640 [Nonomuraea polychroma]
MCHFIVLPAGVAADGIGLAPDVGANAIAVQTVRLALDVVLFVGT